MAAENTTKKPPLPLDKGWAWMIVLGVFIYVFFMVGIAKSYGLFLLAFRSHFEVSTAYAAMPMSMTAFVYAIGAPSAILVAEMITPQRVVIIGAIIGMVGIALCSLLVSMWYIIFIYGICVGIGNSCFYGNGLVMLGKYFRKRRSLATGLGLAGASIGQFVMPPIIEYLLESYGLSGTMLIIAALYSHCAISGALFRPFEQYGPEEEKQVKTVAGEGEEVPELDEDKKALVNTPEFIESQRAIISPAVETNTCSPENCVPVHTEKNGNVKVMQQNNRVSFGNLKSPDESDVIEDGGNLSEYHDNKRWSKGYSENLEDDECFIDRKALLASTGSIFLVSPSILDVSDIDNRAHGLDTATKKKSSSCITRIFDFSILKSYITIFFTIVSFLCFFGYFNHILFLPAIIEERGITKYDKAILISICGAGDLIARIATGFFADLSILPRYQLKAAACVLSGINIFVFIFANTFSWLAFHCFCYGFLGGAYVCLMSVVLVDFVGIQLLAKNLAIILLIQGTGAAFGQSFLGWVRDRTGSYDYVILILSLNLVAGGLLLFCYRFVRRWEDNRQSRHSQTDKTTCVKV